MKKDRWEFRLARRRKAAVCRDWACESTDSPRTGAKKLKMLFPVLTHAASPLPASRIQHDSGTSPNVGLDGTWQGSGNGSGSSALILRIFSVRKAAVRLAALWEHSGSWKLAVRYKVKGRPEKNFVRILWERESRSGTPQRGNSRSVSMLYVEIHRAKFRLVDAHDDVRRTLTHNRFHEDFLGRARPIFGLSNQSPSSQREGATGDRSERIRNIARDLCGPIGKSEACRTPSSHVAFVVSEPARNGRINANSQGTSRLAPEIW